MKKLALICASLLVAGSLHAQQDPNAPPPTTPPPDISQAQRAADMMQTFADPSADFTGLALGAGLTAIGKQTYFMVHAQPQLEFGKFGVGLDVKLHIGKNGIRKEDFDEAYDFLRMINYVSYGRPYEDIYARLGGLTHATIGNGTIVNNYSNTVSFDDRRVGLAGRIAIDAFGGEVLVSDLFRPGLLALRPFLRPFMLAGMSDVWLLKNVEVGVTTAMDFDTNASRVIPNQAPYVLRPDPTKSDSMVVVQSSKKYSTPFTVFGVDLGVPIVETPVLASRAYVDYIKFTDFNDGVVLGARASLALTQLVLLDLKAERSFFKQHFVPNYFNAFYERDRFDNQARPEDYITKATFLADTTGGTGNGFRVAGIVGLGTFAQVEANFVSLDNAPGKDYLDMYLNLPEQSWGFYGGISYTRKNIEGFDDAFKLDKRSLLTAKASFPLISYIYATILVQWTFDRDKEGRLITTQIIEPRLDLRIKI